MSKLGHILTELTWQSKVLQRDNLISISMIITLIYGALVFAFRESIGIDALLTIILINDPVVIGMIFSGLILIKDKNNRILDARNVSPMKPYSYILSIALIFSILGTLSAVLVMVMADYWDKADIMMFVGAAFVLSLQSAFMGIIMATRTDEFMKFILGLVPILMISSLILLKYFRVVELEIFWFIPYLSGFDLFLGTFAADYPLWNPYISFVLNILIAIGLFYLAVGQFEQKIKGNR